jgi:cobalt-zinc-cadmium efflux system protein
MSDTHCDHEHPDFHDGHDHDHEQGHMHGHSHDQSQGHDHSHGLGHSHAPKDFGSAFVIGIGLNLALVIAQVVFGLRAHSLALVADAGHNFADVLGLGLAWWATTLSKSTPTRKHTYGLRSASILAALANAVLLLTTMGAVAWEAIMRLKTPAQVFGPTVIWVATAGIIINGVSALLFFSGRKGDLNVRAAFLHLAADAGISLGVVLAGVAILWTGRLWIDPVVSLGIVGIVVYGTWALLKDSLNLALQAVPPGINADAVRNYLAKQPGVTAVHDLHIWGMSTNENALTAHLLKPDGKLDDGLLQRVCHELDEKFEIHHVTIQLECGNGPGPCQQEPEGVV